MNLISKLILSRDFIIERYLKRDSPIHTQVDDILLSLYIYILYIYIIISKSSLRLDLDRCDLCLRETI